MLTWIHIILILNILLLHIIVFGADVNHFLQRLKRRLHLLGFLKFIQCTRRGLHVVLVAPHHLPMLVNVFEQIVILVPAGWARGAL